MCELFAVTSAEPVQPADYLKEFFSHSVRHPHGWGMMYEQNERIIIKEPVRACDSPLMRSLTENLAPQKNLMAHIRFATVGTVRTENCHPYTGKDLSGREWTLIHNGTIYSGKLNFQYFKKQTGDTDSERLFLALLDTVNERLRRGEMNSRARFETVHQFIISNAPRNKLNLIIYDGELMYVHKNLKNTLSYRRLEHGLLFSTQPLREGEWIPFPTAQVIAYREGRELYRGRQHSGIYIPTLEYIAAADAMNI